MKTILFIALISSIAFAADKIYAYKTKYTVHFLVCPKGMHQQVYIDANSSGRAIERCEKNEKK